jgi:hypothetical protein
MDYVMVPVPEEHVVDVMQHVARLVARANLQPWEDDELVSVFDEVDEASRSVLSLVARYVVADKDLSDEDAAKTLELNVREIRSIVRDLNEMAQTRKREPLLSLREVPVTLRNGRTVSRRLFAMGDTAARRLRVHERKSSVGQSQVADDLDE